MASRPAGDNLLTCAGSLDVAKYSTDAEDFDDDGNDFADDQSASAAYNEADWQSFLFP